MHTGEGAQGIDGILATYNAAVSQVQLSGPTIFSQVLETAAAMSAVGMDGSQYFVLLIITDGVITDMDPTIDAIIKSCNMPLSILIVGVGDADFTLMERLDGDDGKLTSPTNGFFASRDIVQFVALKDFASRPLAFSTELLAEIPHQLCSFMLSKGIKPQQRVAAVPVATATVPVVSSAAVKIGHT